MYRPTHSIKTYWFYIKVTVYMWNILQTAKCQCYITFLFHSFGLPGSIWAIFGRENLSVARVSDNRWTHTGISRGSSKSRVIATQITSSIDQDKSLWVSPMLEAISRSQLLACQHPKNIYGQVASSRGFEPLVVKLVASRASCWCFQCWPDREPKSDEILMFFCRQKIVNDGWAS